MTYRHLLLSCYCKERRFLLSSESLQCLRNPSPASCSLAAAASGGQLLLGDLVVLLQLLLLLVHSSPCALLPEKNNPTTLTKWQKPWHDSALRMVITGFL